DKLQTVTDTALGVAQSLETRVAQQQLSLDQGLQAFRDVLHAMRFDAGDGYIVAYRRDGLVLVHGANPQLENALSTAKAASGVSLTSLLADALRNAERGIIEYDFIKPGQTVAKPKVAYVARFAPWDLALSVGAYTDDLDAAFRSQLKD